MSMGPALSRLRDSRLGAAYRREDASPPLDLRLPHALAIPFSTRAKDLPAGLVVRFARSCELGVVDDDARASGLRLAFSEMLLQKSW